MNMNYISIKNRLLNGIPFSLTAAVERIDALADDLKLTQAEAAELTAMAQTHATPDDKDTRIKALESKLAQLDKMGMRTEREASDKVGYDLVRHYIGDILMKTTYEPSEDAQGTANNPIPWTEETLLIPNAYYIRDGVRKVWMGEEGVTADWGDYRWEVW